MSISTLPPPMPATEQTIILRERLRILAWGYYISAGLGAVFSCFFLIYALMFGAISFVPESEWQPNSQVTGEETQELGQKSDPVPGNTATALPVLVFRILAGVFLVVTVAGWILSGLTAYAAYGLQQRRHKLLIQLMAADNLLWMPYGTALGVFTFITLGTPEASREFEE